MSAERQLNTSEFTNDQLDRFLFSLLGRMKELTVVEKLMTRKEAAAYAGCSVVTIDKLVEAGKLKAHAPLPNMDPRYIPSEVLAAYKKV